MDYIFVRAYTLPTPVGNKRDSTHARSLRHIFMCPFLFSPKIQYDIVNPDITPKMIWLPLH